MRKPVYYTYRYLKQLGSKKLGQSQHMIATMNHPGDIRLICWNRKDLGLKYYTMEENRVLPEEVEELYRWHTAHCLSHGTQ